MRANHSGHRRWRIARSRGRPSNRQRWDEQTQQIQRLRQLLSRRHHSEETWLLIDQLLSLIGELEDLSTPLRAVTYDGTGHSADDPLLPGVTLADDGANDTHPDGDKVTNRGDRTLHHAGTEAAEIHKWLLDMTKWMVTNGRNRLAKTRESPPRPSMPRRKPPESVKSFAANDH